MKIPIADDQHWHSLRAKHVGGSDIASLFDVSPYKTKFTLFHEKAGNVTEDNEGNSRTDWGKRLEPAIAEGVAEEMRWVLRKSRDYHTHDRIKGMGCTNDYDVIDHADGPGIVEIKFVAEYATWKSDWTDKRAPAGIEIQLQHQLATTECSWGAICLFIGQAAALKIYERKANPKVIGEIERRVEAFWQSIAEGKAPDVTGTADEWETLRELYPTIEREKQITIGDDRLADVCQMFVYNHAQEYSSSRALKECKVQLLNALGDAACAFVPGHIIRQRPHGKGRVITVEEHDTGVQHTVLTPTIELA